ncbi:hypothetical protein JVT61DRAFT_8591 [Boletus reticuloceps]|uniref:Uncharacterized protein n=1 Tax=Boletus reticuloceps TaxID=495285 RepID=A0A8I2Z1B1_9AGAM|nr:hypothetical protein JVT61DRAFT_8591 [Boletus reticuloceps]
MLEVLLKPNVLGTGSPSTTMVNSSLTVTSAPSETTALILGPRQCLPFSELVSNMSFPPNVCRILQDYSIRPPSKEYGVGPWLSILAILSPPYEGYMISPRGKTYFERGSPEGIPGFSLAVAKPAGPLPAPLRTILIVEVKDIHHWPDGIDDMLRRVDEDTGRSFSKTAADKLYWIAALGPHWMYGVREEEETATRTLIDWHYTMHDEASFADFQALVALVRAL